MTLPWSEQVARRYRLKLPPDLSAWLDDGVWRESGGAEFRQPESPEQLLDPEPGRIWAGFMLPDTLPIIGNEYGDWLCLRAAPDGTISEVVYWCHGGGDWIPYGRSLAEALLYDAASRVMHQRQPEFVDPAPPDHDVYRAAEWAIDWITPSGRPPARFWEPSGTGAKDATPLDPLQELLAAGVAEVAARRDLILRHLQSPLKARSDPETARQVRSPWEPDYVQWIFDTALIPEPRQQELSRHFDLPIEELTFQDWDAAEAEALKVTQLRRDLGWAFDISGWAAERRGDYALAVERYLAGVEASLFADDSIKFRSHWFAQGYGKFVAARLAELDQHLSPEIREDPYLNLLWANDPESLRARLRDYWLKHAWSAQRQGRFLDAYRYYYNAGWDYGLQYVQSYAEVLEGLADMAEKAGADALASIARVHRSFL